MTARVVEALNLGILCSVFLELVIKRALTYTPAPTFHIPLASDFRNRQSFQIDYCDDPIDTIKVYNSFSYMFETTSPHAPSTFDNMSSCLSPESMPFII